MRPPLLNYPVLLVEVNRAIVTKLTIAFWVCMKGKITKLADTKQINSVPTLRWHSRTKSLWVVMQSKSPERPNVTHCDKSSNSLIYLLTFSLRSRFNVQVVVIGHLSALPILLKHVSLYYATCAIRNLNKVRGILTVELGGFWVAWKRSPPIL